MMSSRKVVCWNSAGIRASGKNTDMKIAFFEKEFPDARFNIAAFIETHHKDSDDFPVVFKGYEKSHHLLHTPTASETHGGIIVLVGRNNEILDQNEVIPGRLLNVKFMEKDSGEHFNLSVFYGPQWKRKKKEEVVEIVNIFSSLHDATDNNIIIGDFNFVEHDVDKGKGMDGKDKMISSVWKDFKTDKLIEDPFRMQFPRKKQYSFVAPSGKSRGDRVYVSEDSLPMLSEIKYTNTGFNSAHKIMTFDLREKRQIGPSYWKLNCSHLEDNLYQQEIEGVINDISDLGIPDPIRRWHLFHIVVAGVSRDYSARKARIKKGIKSEIIKQLTQLETLSDKDMSSSQKKNLAYYKSKFNQITTEEIRGHQIRTRGNPDYEMNEPNIAFYAKLEKKSQTRNTINELQDENGSIKTKNEDLLSIAEKYYRKLFTPSNTDKLRQTQLLRNIAKRINATERQNLDAPITEKELLDAVFQLHAKKSPGPDGIPAEFYQSFWHLIGGMYLEYINAAKQSSFSMYKNTSVTTIIYKRKGKTYELGNYRPISLINVDLKIISKVLTNRLIFVLPSIIHESQTNVFGRRIDYTIHMLRDLIDYTEKSDGEAAFIFLDQEKAFDRVDHDFLFKTMETFGFGETFIEWIKILYSNASTRVKVNGFLTNSIPLKRGIRQGCPLSALLYVIVIEVLALQLRANPNLVGFEIEGEKIISLHYADDAIITITQNNCFKEVIKDLALYEAASGAKVNYDKTKGLWLGRWKDRTDLPLGIKWTNKNIKRLGVYVGNDNPAIHTFEEITPKVERSMNFWKQFGLCTLAKTRVIEIFHASRLWFAATFYPVPSSLAEKLHRAFLAYVNFPNSVSTISQAELRKLREDGGAKLIDVVAKAETYQVRWLIEVTTKEVLHTHLNLIKALLGTQKGGLQGEDFLFTTKHYIEKSFNTNSIFYKSAFSASKKLQIHKGVTDPRDEKLFYNPLFRDAKGKVITINATCEKHKAFTYGQIVDEFNKRTNGQPCVSHVANIFKRVHTINLDLHEENQIFDTRSGEFVRFKGASHKFIYNTLIARSYMVHHSLNRWTERFPNLTIAWDEVWNSVNSPVSSTDSISTVWEQIHLNEYTTSSYNRWHQTQESCPLCLQVPTSRFHITIECPIVIQVWQDISHHLRAIHPLPVSDMEKSFGLSGRAPNILLRNYMTFLLRKCIADQERAAYHNGRGPNNLVDLKLRYNQLIKDEVYMKFNIYKHLGRLGFFEDVFAYQDYLIVWEKNNWQILTIFDIQ